MKINCVLSQNFSFKFEVYRCGKCGTFWAVEEKENFAVSIGITICPACAVEAVEDERKKNRKQWGTIIALKGAISRLQRKGGAK